MAIVPNDEYPTQTIDSDPGYPLGKARNVVTPGDGSGTPLEQRWVNDLWGFLQALLAFGDVVPSGSPDSAVASDYLNALRERCELVGPDSSIDNAIGRFDGISGKVLNNSGVRITDAGLLEYITPTSRTVLVPLSAGYQSVGTTAGSQFAFFAGNSAELIVPLRLPHGAVLTRIRAKVDPGAARATSGNRMRLLVQSFAPDIGAGTTPSPSTIADERDDGTGNVFTIETPVLSVTIDNSTTIYSVGVTAGNDAATNNDRLYGIEVTYTDPGPRNH